MKIQKFDDWTDEKLREVVLNSKDYRKKNESYQVKNMNYLIRILKRYLEWRNDDFDENENFDIIDLFFFKNKFIIECEYPEDGYGYDSTSNMSDDGSDYRDNNSFQIKDIDYEEMIEFLNDPDVFERTKKYNL